MMRHPTPKQQLREHLDKLHTHRPAPARATLEELRKFHAREHHRHTPHNHYHAGVNRGAEQRPAGWYTGRDVVLIPPRKSLHSPS